MRVVVLVLLSEPDGRAKVLDAFNLTLEIELIVSIRVLQEMSTQTH